MNTARTIAEGFIAFCFLALATISWWKWSRDTAVMWTATFVIATASMFVQAPAKDAFIVAYGILMAVTMCNAVAPDMFQLTAGKEKAIIGTLSAVIALGILAVAGFAKDNYLIALGLGAMAWAAYVNRGILSRFYYNPQSGDPGVTPIATAPRVAVGANFRPSVVRDDPAKRLADIPMKVSPSLITTPLPESLYTPDPARQLDETPTNPSSRTES